MKTIKVYLIIASLVLIVFEAKAQLKPDFTLTIDNDGPLDDILFQCAYFECGALRTGCPCAIITLPTSLTMYTARIINTAAIPTIP